MKVDSLSFKKLLTVSDVLNVWGRRGQLRSGKKGKRFGLENRIQKQPN